MRTLGLGRRQPAPLPAFRRALPQNQSRPIRQDDDGRDRRRPAREAAVGDRPLRHRRPNGPAAVDPPRHAQSLPLVRRRRAALMARRPAVRAPDQARPAVHAPRRQARPPRLPRRADRQPARHPRHTRAGERRRRPALRRVARRHLRRQTRVRRDRPLRRGVSGARRVVGQIRQARPEAVRRGLGPCAHRSRRRYHSRHAEKENSARDRRTPPARNRR